MSRRTPSSRQASPSFQMRSRLVALCLAMAGAGLIGRAAYLQVFNTEFLNEQATARHVRVAQVAAHRGPVTDRNGEVVLSRLDEQTLQEIATMGGGQYYRATAAGTELDALVSELDSLQKGAIGSQLEITRIERYQWFLAPALVLLIIATLIPARVSERKQTAAA